MITYYFFFMWPDYSQWQQSQAKELLVSALDRGPEEYTTPRFGNIP
jgi:hypothetical protein